MAWPICVAFTAAPTGLKNQGGEKNSSKSGWFHLGDGLIVGVNKDALHQPLGLVLKLTG